MGIQDGVSPKPTDIVVDTTKLLQRVDGFGASEAFAGGPFTTAQADEFFDVNLGIGLSILRVGIGANGGFLGAGEGANAVMASARGAIVWGTPWSPPPEDTLGENGGGYAGQINPGAYASWATTLASFAATMQDAGVPLYGISVQNEPDYPAATYPSCTYTAAQMVAFIKVLGPALEGLTPRPRLIAPEPDVWTDLWGGPNGYASAIAADPAAAAYVDIYATHDYDHHPVVAPANVPQGIWETEVSGGAGTGNCSSVCAGPNATIDNGILVAQWIYNAFVIGGASAWHYWWLLADDNGGLMTTAGAPAKRLFTLGNFSKFVRPGYSRTTLSGGAVPSGTQVVAFENPVTGALAIVAINANTASTAVSFFVSGTAWPNQVTPWVTSESLDLAAQSPLAVVGARFAATLAAQSVTTFVGTP